MRLPAILLSIGFVFGACTVGQAGVYNTGEPDEGRLDPVYDKFRQTLIVLQSIGVPKVEVEPPIRKRYLLLEDLFAKVEVSKLSPEETLNFGAVLVRRRRPADAIGLLVPAVRRHPQLFLLQSNLATAYQLDGDLLKASETMTYCRDGWPKNWHDLNEPQRALCERLGWNEGPFGFYREVEIYYLKLLRLRSREPKGQFETVDDLFEVKFVADSGGFEPGKINQADKAKLPRNALDIVEQLLVWLPHDLRLQWLLGEVLNARGEVADIKAAKALFDKLVYRDEVRAKELKARRQTLNDWTEPPTANGAFDPDVPARPPSPPPSAPAFDWRSLLVAFGTGVLVTIFGLWQIQEIRRRRQRP